MRRRSFLKIAGLASVGAGLRLATPMWVEPVNAAKRVTAPDGVQYRGDRYGQIFVSHDAGVTWALHTYLGSFYPVKRMGLDPSGRVRANVGYRGRTFKLYLAADQRSWMTV